MKRNPMNDSRRCRAKSKATGMRDRASIGPVRWIAAEQSISGPLPGPAECTCERGPALAIAVEHDSTGFAAAGSSPERSERVSTCLHIE